ncbi:MAG: hypothetical protein GWN67_22035 [Phycisphaerae bacterium]|nr:hypothetical protein [Phycisphaerae bacterium]NIP54758.1 hypothetical protein [Phycisphaerae bacterium]NIS50470.1 hypothetical protein [Phycisphaerae bacterium]NIU11075.1 hypothetical protein [Phycisphaerae bacterium]NIU58961.1 hypothetical protein [Phycisphaerae bacterium]
MAEKRPSENVRKQSKKGISFFTRILIILVVVLVYFLVKILLLMTAAPTISVDYVAEWNKLSRPDDYEPNQNAVPYYKKAFETFWDLPHSAKLYYDVWPNDLNDVELQTIKKWLLLNSRSLNYLEQAFSRPYYWIPLSAPPYPNSFTGAFGHMVSHLQTSNLLKVSHILDFQIKVLFTDGRIELVLERVFQLYKMGAHLSGRKTLNEQLMGIRFKKMAIDNVFGFLDRQQIDAKTLKQWQQMLEHEMYSGRRELYFDNERFITYYIIQRIFTDNGRGDGRLIPGKADRFIEPTIITLISPTEEQMEEFFRDRYLKFIWSALTGPDRRKTVATVDKFFAYVDTLKHQTPWQLHSQGIDSDEEIHSILKGYVIEEIAPQVYQVIEIYQRLKARESALITTIAVLRYKEDKEQFPESLDQLVSAGYLKQLPMDPYSDGPLVYRRQGSDFILYSLGADFDDDGGVHSRWGDWYKGGDQVFWPVKTFSVDLIPL